MSVRIHSLVLSCALILGLAIVAPASADTGSPKIIGTNSSDNCFAGHGGTCSGSAVAQPDGAFSSETTLSAPDLPHSRATRYSQALALYRIGFDLAEPTPVAEITVDLQIDEANAEWSHDTPELFGGTTDDRSGSKVFFQLFGHASPKNCGCGWFGQGTGNVVAAEASEPGQQQTVTDESIELTMNATNPYGDNMLPAGHYELTLRGYARNDLVGSGDWGTLAASVQGRIQDITVTVPDGEEDGPAASNLTLSVSGVGVNRVLTAELTDTDSAPISGRTITFYGDGDVLGSAETDEAGVATLPVGAGKFRGGSRTFTAEFAGDDAYEASSAQARS